MITPAQFPSSVPPLPLSCSGTIHRRLLYGGRRKPGKGGGGGAAAAPPAANLVLWVKADADVYQDTGRTTPATANNDPVKGWTDQSGNSHHLTESTNPPQLKTNQINGKPCVRFDGSNDVIKAAWTLNLDFTIFVVMRKVVATQQKTYMSGISGGLFTLNQPFGRFNYETGLWNGGQFNWGDGMTESTWFSLEVRMSSTHVNNANPGSGLRINGESSWRLPLGAAIAGDRGGLSFGCYETVSDFANVDFAEVLVYASRIGDADSATIHSYYNTKYSIY